MRETFDEVSIRVQRSFRCTDCGKRRTRSRKLWQTVNPFNRTADGTVKTRGQIHKELCTEAEAWQPTACGCSPTEPARE